MKKKVLSLLLALSFGAVILSGCTGGADDTKTTTTAAAKADSTKAADDKTEKSESAGDTAGEGGISAPGVYPIVDEKVDMTVFMTQVPAVTDYDDNRLTEYMEEKTNVRITWQLVSANDREQKLNLMLASGDALADVIMGGVPSPILVDYADQGTFVSLTELIDTQAPYLQEVMKNYDGLRELITAPDGEIYTMPNVTDDLANRYSRRMWINQVWLDALGLDIPETTDDLLNVLRAFRDDDPNGNGKKDEIPMMGSTDGWQASFERNLLNSFLLFQDRDNPYWIDNGEVKATYDSEEYREGLRYLHTLVDEGLYDVSSFTQDLPTFKKIFENEECALVGATPSGGPTSFGTTGSARKNEYVGLPPLKGPEGVQWAGYSPYGYMLYTNTFVVTSACENPAIAVKWADLLYEEETAKRARWGVPGVDYEEAEPGKINNLGEPAEWKANIPWGSEQNSHWAGYNPTLEDFAQRAQKGTDPTDYPKSNYEVTMESYFEYTPPVEAILMPMMFDAETSARMNEIKAILDPYIKESREKFCTGSLDLETDWDRYLEELEKMDYKELIELIQKRHDELMG